MSATMSREEADNYSSHAVTLPGDVQQCSVCYFFDYLQDEGVDFGRDDVFFGMIKQVPVLGLSLTELAKHLNVHRSTVTRWSNSQQSPEELVKLMVREWMIENLRGTVDHYLCELMRENGLIDAINKTVLASKTQSSLTFFIVNEDGEHVADAVS